MIEFGPVCDEFNEAIGEVEDALAELDFASAPLDLFYYEEGKRPERAKLPDDEGEPEEE